MHFSSKRLSWHKSAPEPSSQTDAAAAAAPTPRPRNPARSATVPLIVVPGESSTPPPRGAPPSAFRNFARGGSPGLAPSPSLTSLSNKGKAPLRESDVPQVSRSGWSQWVVDSLEARRGADVWSQGDRVILVLGEATIATLAPLLYSPAFSNTLLLVGSLHRLSDIEALTSPSHLMSMGNDRTIYPTVQPFQPPAGALNGVEHPLHVLLKQATMLAEAHRQGLNPESAPPSRPTSWSARSRRGSSASSTGTQTPPLKRQPSWSRFGTWGRGRQSAASSPMQSPTGSHIDLSKLATASKKNQAPSIMSASSERPRTIRRMASFLKNDNPRVCEGSPFDAVIDIIPSANSSHDPRRVLLEMLQHATVLTTAVLPILTTAETANSMSAAATLVELSPLSLIHIVPFDAPPALAPVVERFLMPLLPLTAARTRRHLFGCVTGFGPWLASMSDRTGDGLAGAETILFGGVRSLAENGMRSQAFLSSWDDCHTSQGALVEASQREEDAPPSAFSRQASSQVLSELRSAQITGGPLYIPTSGSSSPSSARSATRTSPSRTGFPLPHTKSMPLLSRNAPRIGDLDLSTSKAARQPSRLKEVALPTESSGSVPRSPSGLRNSHGPSYTASPPTPELDTSSSSCSSSSVLDPPLEDRSANSSSRHMPSAPNGKAITPPSTKSKVFGGLFKRSRSSVKA